jgi:hypothetical protein
MSNEEKSNSEFIIQFFLEWIFNTLPVTDKRISWGLGEKNIAKFFLKENTP